MSAFEGSIGVVGAGRLGSSLLAALREAGHDARPLDSRAPSSAAIGFSSAVFITVPDAAIRTVAEDLPWRRGQSVVHCSGALGLYALDAAGAAGAAVGCLHPLQSFPSRTPAPERFKDIYCGIEGTGSLAAELESLVLKLGAQPFRLDGIDRALYHAAAVTMNNHAVALAAAATKMWQLAGLPAELGTAALSPLLAAAAANIAALPLEHALTGPVARGDVETVRQHLAALAAQPALRELYRQLSLQLLTLQPDEARAERLRGALAQLP